MRFPIRNIFPRWQIWVHCLSVHSFHLLSFCCYVLSVAQLLLFSGDFGITRLHSGTTCILEHFFRAYMFPFVHSTKKRADQHCTAPTCLKLFLSARWPAVFLRQAHIMLRLCRAQKFLYHVTAQPFCIGSGFFRQWKENAQMEPVI